MSFAETLSAQVKRTAYTASQASRVAWYVGHYAMGRHLMGPMSQPGHAPLADQSAPLDRKRLQKQFRALFERDWRNIAAGVYKMPQEVRGLKSPARLASASRDYLRDARAVARRQKERGHSEVLRADTREKFPRYFLQNFHYQTDGWLSEQSADRYDMQVETIFTGAGHAMRRQALPFVRDAIADRDPSEVRLVDLGCGDGGFLLGVKENWPRLHCTALDLSPAYLGKAQARLGRFDDIVFKRRAAEDSGLPPQSADIVTAVYLFHELPPRVREAVVSEIARILKPGGSMILVDTIQYGDEPGFDILLENFPRGLHEPYYDSYCKMDLEELFGQCGFSRQDESLAFLSKVTHFVKTAE